MTNIIKLTNYLNNAQFTLDGASGASFTLGNVTLSKILDINNANLSGLGWQLNGTPIAVVGQSAPYSSTVLTTGDQSIGGNKTFTGMIHCMNGTYLYSSSGTKSLISDSRILFDVGENTSVDWDNKILYGTGVVQTLNWGNKILNGNWTVDGVKIVTAGDTGQFVTQNQINQFVTQSQTGQFLTNSITPSFLGLRLNIRTTTTGLTLANDNHTVLFSGVNLTGTLPSVITTSGNVFCLKNIHPSSSVTVKCEIPQNRIDLASSYTINSGNKYVSIQSDGINYWVVGNN